MTERTFTEDEIREAIQRVTRSHPLQDDVINEIYRPKTPVIPEGVLCWGWRDCREAWVPCESNGHGAAFDVRGDTYDTIRLTHPDDWAKAPEWAKSYTIFRSGTRLFNDISAEAANRIEGVVYAEGRPE